MWWSPLKKVLGIFLILIGIISGFIPIIQGWIFVLAGLLLLGFTRKDIRRWVKRGKIIFKRKKTKETK